MFTPESDMLKEDDPVKPLATKVYRATYSHQDGTETERYYRGEILLEAAEVASSAVADDPFITLIIIRELGVIN